MTVGCAENKVKIKEPLNPVSIRSLGSVVQVRPITQVITLSPVIAPECEVLVDPTFYRQQTDPTPTRTDTTDFAWMETDAFDNNVTLWIGTY